MILVVKGSNPFLYPIFNLINIHVHEASNFLIYKYKITPFFFYHSVKIKKKQISIARIYQFYHYCKKILFLPFNIFLLLNINTKTQNWKTTIIELTKIQKHTNTTKLFFFKFLMNLNNNNSSSLTTPKNSLKFLKLFVVHLVSAVILKKQFLESQNLIIILKYHTFFFFYLLQTIIKQIDNSTIKIKSLKLIWKTKETINIKKLKSIKKKLKKNNYSNLIIF